MGFDDVLKAHKPVENEDKDGFPVIKGIYKCAISKLKRGITKDEAKRPRYEMELKVVETLEGDAADGRKFFFNYPIDDDAATERFLNDLFTGGITLPNGSVDEFEGAFPLVLDYLVTVRAWGWTPDKKQDQTPIPVEERVARQQTKIVNASKVKVKSKNLSEVPF